MLCLIAAVVREAEPVTLDCGCNGRLRPLVAPNDDGVGIDIDDGAVDDVDDALPVLVAGLVDLDTCLLPADVGLVEDCGVFRSNLRP